MRTPLRIAAHTLFGTGHFCDAGWERDMTASEPVSCEADLLRLAGQPTRTGLLAMIRADAAPLQVEDDGWDEGGFMLFIGNSIGVGFEMSYPFTMAEFWAALARVEQTARKSSS